MKISNDRAFIEEQINASYSRIARRISKAAEDLKAGLEKKLQSPARPSPPELDAILQYALANYRIANDVKQEVLNAIEAAIEAGLGRPAAQTEALRHYWLTKERSVGGLSLTDRITDRNINGQIYRIIRNAIDICCRVLNAASQLSRAGTQNGDVAAGTAALLCRIRQLAAAAHDPEAATAFAAICRQKLRSADRLIEPGITKLRQTYGEINDLCGKWAWLRVQEAIGYAADDLQQSNALRLLNTEAGRAYGMARRALATKTPGITGLKVKAGRK